LDLEGMQIAEKKAFGAPGAEPVRVVAFVGEKVLGPRQGRKHERRALVVAHLALREEHDERPAVAVADRMQLRVQPAFRAPDTSGNRPFFRRLEAVSIMIRSALAPLCASSAKIRLNTPTRLQRTKRL
jgi:hypothetical protein